MANNESLGLLPFELDCFLAQALSMHRKNPLTLHEVKVDKFANM